MRCYYELDVVLIQGILLHPALKQVGASWAKEKKGWTYSTIFRGWPPVYSYAATTETIAIPLVHYSYVTLVATDSPPSPLISSNSTASKHCYRNVRTSFPISPLQTEAMLGSLSPALVMPWSFGLISPARVGIWSAHAPQNRATNFG